MSKFFKIQRGSYVLVFRDSEGILWNNVLVFLNSEGVLCLSF